MQARCLTGNRNDLSGNQRKIGAAGGLDDSTLVR